MPVKPIGFPVTRDGGRASNIKFRQFAVAAPPLALFFFVCVWVLVLARNEELEASSIPSRQKISCRRRRHVAQQCIIIRFVDLASFPLFFFLFSFSFFPSPHYARLR